VNKKVKLYSDVEKNVTKVKCPPRSIDAALNPQAIADMNKSKEDIIGMIKEAREKKLKHLNRM